MHEDMQSPSALRDFRLHDSMSSLHGVPLGDPS